MDHLFNVFTLRWADNDIRQSRSCGDIPDLYTSKKKRSLKRALFGSRCSASPSFERTMSNELMNSVDAQLMQIREKLAAFREQDTRIRERMDSLSSSVSELTSQSSQSGSPTLSECSDLGTLDDEAMLEEFEQRKQRAFSREPHIFCIPTVIVTECKDDFDQTPVRSLHMRRVTLHSSKMSYLRLPEEIRHSTPSANQLQVNLYPNYNVDNPEEISTLF